MFFAFARLASHLTTLPMQRVPALRAGRPTKSFKVLLQATGWAGNCRSRDWRYCYMLLLENFYLLDDKTPDVGGTKSEKGSYA